MVLQAMGSASEALSITNENMDISSISKMLGQFEKEKMKFEMKNEVMGDAMAATAEQEDEADDVYN